MADDLSLYARLSGMGTGERIAAFVDWWERGEEELPLEGFYEALRLVWSSGEMLHQDAGTWESVWGWEALRLEQHPEQRAKLMTPDEMATS